jgi:hypothetical protein
VQAGAKIVVGAAREREQDAQQRPLAKAEASAVRRPTTAHPRRTTTRTGARGGALSRAAQKEDSRFRITPRRAVIVAPPPVLFRWRGCCGGCCDGCCRRFLLEAALLPPLWLRTCLMSVLLRASHAAAAALPRTRVAYAKLSRHCQTVASSTAFYVLVMRCDASAWRIVWGSGTRPCDNVSRQNVP